MRAVVIGHVEWIDFVRVPRIPGPGEIVHVSESWEEPGGGGAVAAVQLVKLAGGCTFFTALGDDERGRRAAAELASAGVRVEAAFRPEPQRRAITHIDEAGERAITVLGDRLVPNARDHLAWELLDDADAVFVTGCDEEVLRRARAARVLVATARMLPVLRRAAVPLDAVLGSANDPAERFAPADLDPPPALSVWTDGARGGTYEEGGAPVRYAAAPLPGPIVDTYGAGDSFMAALTFALARGDDARAAVAFAARCGAAVLTGRGPYATQLHA